MGSGSDDQMSRRRGGFGERHLLDHRLDSLPDGDGEVLLVLNRRGGSDPVTVTPQPINSPLETVTGSSEAPRATSSPSPARPPIRAEEEDSFSDSRAHGNLGDGRRVVVQEGVRSPAYTPFCGLAALKALAGASAAEDPFVDVFRETPGGSPTEGQRR
jgi:hypothetical protein